MKRFRGQGFDVVIGIIPALLLAGCGGGSGGPPAQPPTAAAGSALTVNKRVTVTLDGSGSSFAPHLREAASAQSRRSTKRTPSSLRS